MYFCVLKFMSLVIQFVDCKICQDNNVLAFSITPNGNKEPCDHNVLSIMYKVSVKVQHQNCNKSVFITVDIFLHDQEILYKYQNELCIFITGHGIAILSGLITSS